MSDVTEILYAIQAGDGAAAADLLPLVYQELKALAVSRMAKENAGHTLQPTALVHEAYLRLVDTERAAKWDSRGHFFAAASEAMRRILIDHARHKRSQRGGGKHTRVEIDLELLGNKPPADDLISLDEAIIALKEKDPQVGQLVELRCFGGLTIETAAELLGMAERTAYREWQWARAWLYRRLQGDEPAADTPAGNEPPGETR